MHCSAWINRWTNFPRCLHIAAEGLIREDQFITWFQKMQTLSTPESEDKTSDISTDLFAAFRLFDKDGNGYITLVRGWWDGVRWDGMRWCERFGVRWVTWDDVGRDTLWCMRWGVLEDMEWADVGWDFLMLDDIKKCEIWSEVVWSERSRQFQRFNHIPVGGRGWQSNKLSPLDVLASNSFNN